MAVLFCAETVHTNRYSSNEFGKTGTIGFNVTTSLLKSIGLSPKHNAGWLRDVNAHWRCVAECLRSSTFYRENNVRLMGGAQLADFTRVGPGDEVELDNIPKHTTVTADGKHNESSILLESNFPVGKV
jgi:hypothetical protein